MKYKEMLEDAKAKGLTSEKVMWESIEDMDDMLCMMKHEHPKEYWALMRRMHGRLYKHHYDEEFARHDVGNLSWTDKQGAKHTGEHWSPTQVEEATRGKSFPAGTTMWDKWVAYNALYADLCKEFSDEEILRAAYQFWFADEDFGSEGKVWRYFCMKNS
jgi:hypothetical protein